jgi:hypothetical protein
MENKISLNVHNVLVIGVAALAFTIALNLLASTLATKGIPIVSPIASGIKTAEKLGSGQ